MNETTHKQFQTIVNNAQSISGAQLVVLCILNETTKEFEYKAIDQVNAAEIQNVIEDAIKLAPSFKLLNYSFPNDINSTIKKIVSSKSHFITNLQTAIENIIPKIVIATAQKNLAVKSTAIFPITVDHTVIGLMGYFFSKDPLEKDISVMEIFTNQVTLLFENFKVSENLYEKLKEETIKLEEERNNLDSKVKERTLKLDNSRSALLFMLKDIDKASKELAAAKEYTDNIIKSMIDALIVVDTNAIIQKVNQSTLTLLGYEEHELIGKPFKIVFETDDSLFKGSNIEDLFKRVCVSNVEKTYITKNSNKISVLFSGSVMYDENSNVSGIVCVALSNTKRKIAEKALKDSEQRMKHLLSSNPAVIYTSQAILPFNWTYISDNIESLTGYTPKELINTPYFRENHIHPEEQERFFKELPLLFKNGHYIQEYRFLCKNGSYLWLLDEIKLIYDTNGNPIEAIGYLIDITVRKNADQELIVAKEKAEESDRLKSAFLANMSHEIRTPMNGILGFAELLKNPKLTGEEQQMFIDIIKKSGERMLNIINDLISISKVESGQMEITYSETNINEQLDFLYNFFKLETKQKGVILNLHCPIPFNNAIINTDREKIYAILTNLIKNAVKFTSVGSIEFGYSLKTNCEPNELEFYVKDTGVGIPVNKQKAVFERFVQADISLSRGYEGAGLGLSISKAYVEMLGGNIWMESIEGVGSQFYFTTPIHDQSIIKYSLNEDNPINLQQIINNSTILIAEDDETALIYYSEILKNSTFKLFIANTGDEAVEICRNNSNIDLVLMDIKMPVMDGHTAAKLIKEFRPNLKIIAQTAFALDTEKEKYGKPFDDYITKPIKIDELVYKVNNNLKRK